MAVVVISGVAEKLEKSILSFVMLDAFFPETGQALVDLQPPAVPGKFCGSCSQWRIDDTPEAGGNV